MHDSGHILIRFRFQQKTSDSTPIPIPVNILWFQFHHSNKIWFSWFRFWFQPMQSDSGIPESIPIPESGCASLLKGVLAQELALILDYCHSLCNGTEHNGIKGLEQAIRGRPLIIWGAWCKTKKKILFGGSAKKKFLSKGHFVIPP